MDSIKKIITNPFTDENEVLLYSIFKQLNKYGCTYMYYTIYNPQQGRLRFTTDENWINYYNESGIIHDDPIKAICEQGQNRILTWNNVPLSDIKQKKVMQARGYIGIYNGINVIRINPDKKQQKIVGLCTDSKSHHLMNELLANPIIFKQTITQILKVA